MLLILLLARHSFVYAQTPVPVEYQLKAVFLFNFTRFVEWPPAVFENDQAPFVIGVLGENPFGTYLEGVGAGEKVNGHPLVIRYFKNTAEIKSCQILFLNKTNVHAEENALAACRDKNMLTVSDAPGFLEKGGIIRFFIVDNKVQLQINQEASRLAGLQISSKL
ncbi:MAG TPA: YfiR family protein, partial [Bacteroidia bacterium]|nr:YfiR family protein [Bacteroidia bacterium]